MADHSTVLIVGAGPVGLTLANELVRHGVAVRIVDKAAARTDKSKALVCGAARSSCSTMRATSSRSCRPAFRSHGAQISTGKEIVARVSLDSVDSRFPYALMIPQSETERILEERLASHGVSVERSVELTGFTDKGASVEATLKRADGTERDTGSRLAGGLRRCPFGGAARARLRLRRLHAGKPLGPGRRSHLRASSRTTGCTSSGIATASWPSSRSSATAGGWWAISVTRPTANARPIRPWRRSTRCWPIAARRRS